MPIKLYTFKRGVTIGVFGCNKFILIFLGRAGKSVCSDFTTYKTYCFTTSLSNCDVKSVTSVSSKMVTSWY